MNKSKRNKWLRRSHITANKNYHGSLKYMKTCTTLVLTSLVYNKRMFPEDSFTSENYNGISIPVLKEKSIYCEANIFHSWIIGLHDAINRKYLREVELNFYENSKQDKPIESGRILFDYQKKFIFDTSKRTKQDTITLISQLKKIGYSGPETKMMMILYYYDEVTPLDYEPPISDPSSGDIIFDDSLYFQKKLMGAVTAKLHRMKIYSSHVASDKACTQPLPSSPVSIKIDVDFHRESALVDLTQDENGEALKTNETFMNNDNKDCLIRSDDLQNECIVIEDLTEDDTDDDCVVTSNSNSQLLTRSQVKIEGQSVQKNKNVMCPCKKKELLTETLKCLSCKTFQHLTCFGLLKASASKEHYCDQCAKENRTLKCTDSEFIAADSLVKEKKCLIRNALAICNENDFVSQDDFKQVLKVSKANVDFIFDFLEESNLLDSKTTSQTKTRPQRINKDILNKKILPLYFKDL